MTCQLLQPPSNSCIVSSCRQTAAPTGSHFPFFWWAEEKQCVLLLLFQGHPAHGGFHCGQRMPLSPPAPRAVPGTRRGEAKAVPGPPASTASGVLKALDIISCYPESGPEEDLRMFCTTVEKRRKMSERVAKMLVPPDSGKRRGSSPGRLSYRRCGAVVSVGTGLFPGEAMLRQPVP